MSSLRKQVFTERVLKKLFPNVSSGQEKGTPQTPALETPSKDVTPEAVQQKDVHSLTDGDIKIQPDRRRLYTVSLPPQGYIPCLPEPTSCAASENASSGGDTEDLELPEQPKRRRIRRHKSKKNITNLSDVIVRQTELETQEKMHPQHPDAPAMSKNKRRKLKTKLRLRRKREAGLATKASGVSFTYQPESSDEVEAEDDVGGEEEGDPERLVADITQDDIELASSRAEGVLSFLKSTQEIYFYDDPPRDDPAVCLEASEELLHLLESGSMPPADVLVLDHMKTLLLLQDTERLKSALKMFPDHCTMPPDHAKIITAFFNYWITQILPEKSIE
ncbi:glutamate-rich protein 1 [Mus pahari]|uniref:glutamate-rich protein 1 n=1 Tax=Mus pahari TaxID=10093 RepID=UPI000FC8E6ED|nr:glutamate-rich protein 1 [Mus pahari]